MGWASLARGSSPRGQFWQACPATFKRLLRNWAGNRACSALPELRGWNAQFDPPTVVRTGSHIAELPAPLASIHSEPKLALVKTTRGRLCALDRPRALLSAPHWASDARGLSLLGYFTAWTSGGDSLPACSG